MTTSRVDNLISVALVGTALSLNASIATGAPVDQLPLPGEDAGRDLLLRAGALATFRAAGRLPIREVAAPEPAADETRPPCPPEAAGLIVDLLTRRAFTLLPEAFARVERSNYLLPPTLLPLALDAVPPKNRLALIPLLGARGRWLARFNPAWAWAAETPPSNQGALPLDAETVWQEGATAERVALLARLRTSDPAKARAWLEGVWKQEKADTRAAMLETFATGLSPDDEPLLDAALSDRGQRVRAVAADLLTLLTNSALAGRIRQRADAALTYDGVILDANPPRAIDDDWTHDGLRAQSNMQQGGQRAFWLAEMLGRVPPAHWEERFGKPPAKLITDTVGSMWRGTILQAWTDAAVRFQDVTWAVSLWNSVLAMQFEELKRRGLDRGSICRSFAPLLPSADLEALALRVLANPGAYEDIHLHEALGYLPRPWSLTVAHAYLDGLLRAVTDTTGVRGSLGNPWSETMRDATQAMPEGALATAVELIAPHAWRGMLDRDFNNQWTPFAETIRLRERLVKVLPL